MEHSGSKHPVLAKPNRDGLKENLHNKCHFFWIYRVPQKKLSFVEIGCGKYITAVTPPFKIVLALIYPRHSTGDPEHPTGGIGGAHGRGGGVGVDHQGGHQDVQGLGQGEEFRVETVVSDDYIVLGGCWGND